MKKSSNTKSRRPLLPLLPFLLASCASTIQKETVVQAPIEEAWRVLAEEFANVDSWAASIPTSYARTEGPTLPGAPAHGRVCETPLGTATETLTRYDRTEGIVAYDAEVDTFPFFVSGLSNQWSLTAEGPNRTRIVMKLDADIWPVFNLVMWPFMKGRLEKVLSESTEELQTYLETGAIHERKANALAAAAEEDAQ